MYTRAGLKSWMQHSASQAVSIHLRSSSHRACLLSQSTSESRGLHGLSHHDWKKGASNEETRQPTPPAIGPASKPKVRILVCQHCVLCVTRAEPRLSGVKGRPDVIHYRPAVLLPGQTPGTNRTSPRPNVMEHLMNETGANQTGNGAGSAMGSSAAQLGTPLTPLTTLAHVPESGELGNSALVQPWRCFWPPTIGSDTYRKLEDEHPDVLTWRFDITRPFDRPWRLWTGPAAVEGGGCPYPLDPIDGPPSKY